MSDNSEDFKASIAENPYTHINFLESTQRDSSYYPESLFSPWNPDDLVQKDQNYSVYDEMLKDDQVSVALQLKKDLILCSGFDFVPQEDGQEEIVEDLNIAVREDPRWPFEDMLEEILSACEYGFSVSEKIFKLRSDGRLSLDVLKTRHPGSWLLTTDIQGNITKYEQIGTNKSTLIFEPQTLLHFINKRKFDNPYGISDLRPAYQAWFAKKHITRWYSIFIERAAGPIPVAKYPKELSNAKRLDLYNAIKRFQTKTALLVPKDVEVEFLNAQNDGQAFIRGINIFNMFIGRSLLIPDLLGFQGSETSGGSFSLGASQMEIFFKHIKRRQELLEKTINNEIVWPIVAYNFGQIDNYPKFKFRPITNQEIIEGVKIWLEAVKSGLQPTDEDIAHFKGILNFPKSEALSEEAEDEPIIEPASEIVVSETDDGDETVLQDKRYEKERKFQAPSGPFSNKVNFLAIERQLEDAQETFLASSKILVDEIFEEFLEFVERKKIVQNQNVDKLDSLRLKRTSLLRTQLNKAFLELFKKSKKLAELEIFKTSFAKPLPDEKFLEVLNTENFNFIKDWEYKISQNARLKIIAAIKDGKGIADVLDGIGAETKEAALVSVERYSRTKFTEVMNKGRLAFFNESKVVQGFQYAAILDDRTCFLAGTLVRMSNMMLKPIEMVQAGEFVISGNGKSRRVKARKIAVASRWRKINLEGTKQICSTLTHPFWAVQQGSFRWMEAGNLSKDDELGRIDLRSLQQTIPIQSETTKQVLQSRMLLPKKKSKNDKSHLSAVRQSIPSTQQLARSSSDRCKILQQKMPSKKSDKRDFKVGIKKSMSSMRQGISYQPRGIIKREKSSTLQQGLPEKTNNQALSKLSKIVHNKIIRQPDLLQRRMLPLMGRRDETGNRNQARINKTGNSICPGNKIRSVFNRLPTDGQCCLRSGRDLLASQPRGFGYEKGKSDKGRRISVDSYQSRPLESRNANTALARDCHDVVPTPNAAIKIEEIETIEKLAFCYDLEIENDHSYLIGESNIIVHNTEICRGLHGKIFKKGTEPVPPLHFSCRSVLVPITIYEEMTPDEMVGKTPIEQFIEEKKGVGFPKR